MKTIRLCPGCGSPITGDAPAGLCPQCLLKTQVGTDQDSAGIMEARALPVPGGQFGDYRILKLLGHGGMGEVYEAEHATTVRRVALKVMRHALASEEDRKRFLREGRLAASVNHPNVVYIHGGEEIEGAPAIAMELVHGGTLKDRLKSEGPLALSDAIEGTLQIIDGLEAAHAAGVLHRDIKPANCFVAADGAVKVGDFGLSVSTLARGESLITASGAVMGTPAYASPEQLRGEELDVRSDIYSVGATLYHLLTGNTPFNATDFVKLITEVLDKQPASPKSLRPDMPVELSKVLMRCLAKDRKARFQSYSELRDALLPFRASEMVPARPAMRFLAGLIDDSIAYGPNFLFLAYWSFDPLDKLARERTLHAALVGLPFYVWYLLYYSISEGFWGGAVGKTLLGLRVIGRDGQSAGWARAAVRVLVYMSAWTLPWLLMIVIVPLDKARAADEWLLTDWLWIPLTVLLYVTMRARNGYAALQDLASGTRVIVRPRTQPRPRLRAVDAAPKEAQQTKDCALTRAGPYEISASLWKSVDQELAIAFDPALRRKVWIHLKPAGAITVTDARRDLSRPGRLRWIDSGRTDGQSWDAYEALEGAPFLAAVQKPQPWNAVRFWLLDLAEECAAAVQFPETAPSLALNRLWITAAGRAVLLEFSAPGQNVAEPHALPPLDGMGAIQQFLAEVSRRALEGGARASSGSESIHALVPLHARSFLGSLLRRAFDEPRFIVGNLQSLIAKPAENTRARRAASMAFVPGIALGLGALLVAMIAFERIRWDRAWAAAYPGEPSIRVAAEIYLDESEAAKEGNGNREAVTLVGTYIANHFGTIATNESFWTSRPHMKLEPDLRSNLRDAVQKHSVANSRTIAKAEREIPKRIAKRERVHRFSFIWIGAGLAAIIAALAALVDLIGAIGFGVFPLLRLFGFAVVNRIGEPASRGRSLTRWAWVWIPASTVTFFMTAIAASVAKTEPLIPLGIGLGLLLALVAALDAVMIYAVLHPGASLQDRLAGTRLVPV